MDRLVRTFRANQYRKAKRAALILLFGSFHPRYQPILDRTMDALVADGFENAFHLARGGTYRPDRDEVVNQIRASLHDPKYEPPQTDIEKGTARLRSKYYAQQADIAVFFFVKSGEAGETPRDANASAWQEFAMRAEHNTQLDPRLRQLQTILLREEGLDFYALTEGSDVDIATHRNEWHDFSEAVRIGVDLVSQSFYDLVESGWSP